MTTPVTYSNNGRTIELPKLRVGQILLLCEEIRDRRIADIVATLDSPAEQLDAIRELDRSSGLALEVIPWSYTVRGTVRVIEESLKQLDDGTTIDDLDLDLARDDRVAAQLLGFSAVDEINAKAKAKVAAEAASSESEDADPTGRPMPSGT